MVFSQEKTSQFYYSLFIALVLSFSSQTKADEAGVVLTFDDESVTQWFDYFSNQSADVRATFFTSKHKMIVNGELIEKVGPSISAPIAFASNI